MAENIPVGHGTKVLYEPDKRDIPLKEVLELDTS
jgi:hypothetical protein